MRPSELYRGVTGALRGALGERLGLADGLAQALGARDAVAERFTEPLSSETMVRGWNVDGLSVRPDHRMVAHTGFLMTARRVADGVELPSFRRRAAKADFAEADIEAWTPGALGDRMPSDKRARRARRDAQRQADAIAAGSPAPAPAPSPEPSERGQDDRHPQVD